MKNIFVKIVAGSHSKKRFERIGVQSFYHHYIFQGVDYGLVQGFLLLDDLVEYLVDEFINDYLLGWGGI